MRNTVTYSTHRDVPATPEVLEAGGRDDVEGRGPSQRERGRIVGGWWRDVSGRRRDVGGGRRHVNRTLFVVLVAGVVKVSEGIEATVRDAVCQFGQTDVLKNLQQRRGQCCK